MMPLHSVAHASADKILWKEKLRSSNFMRQQTMSSRIVYGQPFPVGRLVQGIADRQFMPIFCHKLTLQGLRTTRSNMVVDHMGLGSS